MPKRQANGVPTAARGVGDGDVAEGGLGVATIGAAVRKTGGISGGGVGGGGGATKATANIQRNAAIAFVLAAPAGPSSEGKRARYTVVA